MSHINCGMIKLFGEKYLGKTVFKIIFFLSRQFQDVSWRYKIRYRLVSRTKDTMFRILSCKNTAYRRTHSWVSL